VTQRPRPPPGLDTIAAFPAEPIPWPARSTSTLTNGDSQQIRPCEYRSVEHAALPVSTPVPDQAFRIWCAGRPRERPRAAVVPGIAPSVDASVVYLSGGKCGTRRSVGLSNSAAAHSTCLIGPSRGGKRRARSRIDIAGVTAALTAPDRAACAARGEQHGPRQLRPQPEAGSPIRAW